MSSSGGGATWRRCRPRFDCLEKYLNRGFRLYAAWVCQHPWPFIVVPVLLSVVLSAGIPYRHVLYSALYLYTPQDGTSKYEQRVFEQTWPQTNTTFQPSRSVIDLRQCQVIVSARDHGNVLRPALSKAVLRLNDFIVNDIV
ncbi:hypothetical protein D917_10472, partial [Trichinella nativa]